MFRTIIDKFLNISTQNNSLTIVLIILCVTALYFILKTRRNSPIKKWVQVGRIKKLAIYPLKSCLGIEVSEALVTQVGLRDTNRKYLRDRVFMIQGPNDTYQDSEKIPKMTTISTEVRQDSIVLRSPYTEDIEVSIPEDIPENRRKCKFHTEKIAEVLDCGDEVAYWLDEFLGQSGFRLYYHHSEVTHRAAQSPLQKRFQVPPSAKGTLQHDTSYMLMSQDSMDALNQELTKPVPYDSFRPSILVEGTKAAFAEDFWDIIRIGSESNGICLKYWLPCARCGQVNIDQDVGVMSEDREPLKTLYKLQRQITNDPVINKYCQGKPIMGIHMGLLPNQDGTQAERVIRIGDPIYALV